MVQTTIRALILALGMAGEAARAEVYYSKDEAFELAFGVGATVEPLSLYISEEQATAIEKLARVKLDTRLFTFHVGKRNDQVLGYAAIEAHTVRTQPETVLIALDAAGKLKRLEVLAFHEPPEYQPPVRWFDRLIGRPINDLILDQTIDGVAGATLSSRAALDGARKILAIYQVMVQEEKR